MTGGATDHFPGDDSPGDDYLMLDCPEPRDWDDSAMLEATPLPPGEKSWRLGRRFAAPVAEPIEIAIDPTHTDDLLELYTLDALVMTRRLLAALEAAGVDNLDAYEAVIRNPETGFATDDYVAVNLIGLVRAADLERSRVVGGSSDGLIDVDLDGVAIDPARAHGLLMFRLAENTSAVVVHRRVARHLLATGFDMLSFRPPATWKG